MCPWWRLDRRGKGRRKTTEQISSLRVSDGDTFRPGFGGVLLLAAGVGAERRRLVRALEPCRCGAEGTALNLYRKF